jgi:hypothetical protein
LRRHQDEALHSGGEGATDHKAVLEACDAIDGIKDGVLDDPKRCKSILACWNAKGRMTPPA